MHLDPVEICAPAATSERVRAGNVIDDKFIGCLLKKSEGTDFFEGVRILVHDNTMLRQALDYQSTAMKSAASTSARAVSAANARVRDLEDRISRMIQADRGEQIRRVVRGKLNELLEEL